MASVWGTSWGTSWGSSWAEAQAAAAITGDTELKGGGGKRRKSHRPRRRPQYIDVPVVDTPEPQAPPDPIAALMEALGQDVGDLRRELVAMRADLRADHEQVVARLDQLAAAVADESGARKRHATALEQTLAAHDRRLVAFEHAPVARRLTPAECLAALLEGS